MAKLKLDLHEIFDDSSSIDQALNTVLATAIERRIPLVEIIPGRGSGQLKARIIRFLQRPAVKKLYHRYTVDPRNCGRLFVHFAHPRGGS